jgi:hypothetical protein
MLLTHMRFLYEDFSAINQMRFLYEDFSIINIAFPYESFIWEFLSYQYCSFIWDFYIRIFWLSKSSMSVKLMSIQSSMNIKFDEHSIIDEHQTRWTFNHRWASNRWTLNWWHQQTNHSLSLYNIYDRVWMSFSYASADVNRNFFVSMTNFENEHLTIWLMNLMRIRLQNRELDENQTWESWTWWKSKNDELKT